MSIADHDKQKCTAPDCYEPEPVDVSELTDSVSFYLGEIAVMAEELKHAERRESEEECIELATAIAEHAVSFLHSISAAGYGRTIRRCLRDKFQELELRQMMTGMGWVDRDEHRRVIAENVRLKKSLDSAMDAVD